VNRLASLLRRVLRQRGEKLRAAARIAPLTVDETEVEPARFRGNPDLAHRWLQVDDDLRAVLEFEGQDIAAALEFDVGFRVVERAFDGG
jgi:hypothetical protein